MKIKKVCAMALCTALALGTLSGCGSQKEENKESSVAQESKTEESKSEVASSEEEADYSDVTFRIAWWGGDTRHLQTIEMIEEFEALYPGLRVEVDYCGWGDYATKITTLAAGNDLPDVMQVTYPMVPDYARNGVLAPIDSFIDDGSIDMSKVSETNLASGIYEDQLYAIPTGVNALCMMYNQTKLDEAGATLSINPTISEYTAACKAVYEKTGAIGDYHHDTIYFRSLGGDQYVKEGDALGYTGEMLAGTYALKMEGIKAGYYKAPGAVSAGSTGADFAQGNIWSFNGFTNQVANYEAEAGMELGLACLPYPDEGTDNATYLQPTMMWGVSAGSENKELAAAFINFFMNTEVVYDICGTDRGLPINSDIRAYLAEKATPVEQRISEFITYLEDGHLSEFNPNSPAKSADAAVVLDSLNEKMMYLQIAEEDLLDACNEAVEEMNNILAGK